MAEAMLNPEGSIDPIDQLQHAIDQTGRIVSGIRPDQADLPTPCPDWDVQRLAEHVVRDLRMFTARAGGAEWKEETPSLSPDEWADVYQDSADALVGAWRDGGPLDQVVKLPFGEVPKAWFVGQQLSDVIVHGWDLAVATGQSTEFDQGLAATALDWGRTNLKPEYRGRDFGPEVDVPAEAPAMDRLVGFFGRNPSWAPPAG